MKKKYLGFPIFYIYPAFDSVATHRIIDDLVLYMQHVQSLNEY